MFTAVLGCPSLVKLIDFLYLSEMFYLKKSVFLFSFCLFIQFTYGQLKIPDFDFEGTNAVDKEGLRQGNWVTYGFMRPDKNYCDTCKIEEGTYIDNRKEGKWTKYYKKPNIPRLIGKFENGRPNGFYTKYYKSGLIMEEGTYTEGKLINTFMRYYKSGCLSRKSHFNSKGERDKITLLYYNDCVISDSIQGKLIGGPNEKDRTSMSTVDNSLSNGPDGSVGKPKGNLIFKPNGYNTLYNKNGGKVVQGTYSGGRLWSGKYYKYNANNILLKVEIWREGKYHSDAQL